MLEHGELSQITANAELAERLLATARQHLASARLLGWLAGWLARPAGFEPATRCLEGSCWRPPASIWPARGCLAGWRARQDSNPRPAA
jgi:hypothetical protein